MSERPRPKDLSKVVYHAYERLAEKSLKALKDGYRFNHIYVAAKALSDWDLLASINISDKLILNVGCGEPIDELFFARRKIRAWIVLDSNLKMLQMARTILEHEASGQVLGLVQFTAGDATYLPFADESFDVTLSFSTLEHIPDPREREMAMREIVRVTKQGGHVVITVPNRYSIFYFTHRRNIRLGISDYGYAYLYGPFELRKILRKLNLEILQFGSELNAISVLPSFLPWQLRRVLRCLCYFGERIGYLAKKV